MNEFPAWVLSGIAVAVFLGVTFAIWRHLTRDRSPPFTLDMLVGARGTIIAGSAARGSPARAAVPDRLGRLHEVMVEPHDQDEPLAKNDEIVLVHLQGELFYAIAEAPLTRDGG